MRHRPGRVRGPARRACRAPPVRISRIRAPRAHVGRRAGAASGVLAVDRGLAESRDEALAQAEAAEDAARALGDLGADTTPSLGVLRESASRLARLADTEGAASVHEIVDELYAVERAVASLLGAIALAAETDIGRGVVPEHLDPASQPKSAEWTTTGVLAP